MSCNTHQKYPCYQIKELIHVVKNTHIMSEILYSKVNPGLKKQILLTLQNADEELSYDELVSKLEIKVRKRLTDSMTILRKKMWISQTKNGVKLTPLGMKLIDDLL